VNTSDEFVVNVAQVLSPWAKSSTWKIPYISTSVPNPFYYIGARTCAYGAAASGVVFTTWDTISIANDLLNWHDKRELPSQKIRDLTHIIESMSIEEVFEDEKLKEKRRIKIRVINKGWYIARCYIKYKLYTDEDGLGFVWITKLICSDYMYTKNTNTQILTGILPLKANESKLVIEIYTASLRSIYKGVYSEGVIEIDIPTLPCAKSYTLRGSFLNPYYSDECDF
jgi:hypothetical protein